MVKPAGRSSTINALQRTFHLIEGPLRNFRVPGCISLARATRFETFRKTVTLMLTIIKYVLSLYLASVNISQGISVGL